MEATGVDVLISAPQKGWSALAVLRARDAERARDDAHRATTSTSFACDLRKWLQIMEAYEKGGHAYHATLPTDACGACATRCRRSGATASSARAPSSGSSATRCARCSHAAASRASPPPGFEAPGVVVSYTDDHDMQNGRKFPAQGLQTAAGVPLQCDEPADFQHLPHRPVRPRQAAERRAHRGEPRARARRDRLGAVPGGRGTGRPVAADGGRRDAGTRRDPAPGLRLPGLPRRAAGDRRARRRRRRRARADADRRRQVALLPDSGARARRRRRRRLAADRADAGPGRRAAASSACARRSSTRRLDAETAARVERDVRAGRARPALRRARAAADAALPRAAGRARDATARALRHRRGALRLAVGPRLPARVPAAVGARTSAIPACRASR